MRYLGRLALLGSAALLAGWANAGTLTLNGNNCGNTTGNVQIDGSGNITVATDGSCAPGGGGTTTYGVTVSAPTGGLITGTGISCGTGGTGDCSEGGYASGAAVSLTAAPASGYTFTGWGGDCAASGTNTTCNLSMTSNKSVSATFNGSAPPPPPPGDCPAGVICVDKTGWPNLPQQQYSMRGNEVMAFRVTTTAAGASGRLVTNYTTGSTGTRDVSLSTTAGDFSGSNLCVKSGLEQTTTYWQQGGTSGWKCVIPANSPLYINVKFTNCPSNSTCSFYMSNN